MAEVREAPRSLGYWDVTLLIVGSMVGSGVFFLPGGMLAQVGSAWPVMAAWAVGGVAALMGAFLFAELGAAFPKAGGQVAFLRDGLGKAWGFLFSWSAFTVVQTGTIAAVAVALAGSVDFLADRADGAEVLGLDGSVVDANAGLPGEGFCIGEVNPGLGRCLGLPVPKWSTAFIAVAVVWVLTAVNFLGAKRGAWLNNGATVAKLAAIVFVLGVAFTAPQAGNFGGDAPTVAGSSLTIAGFGLAVASSLFAYDGFAQATFVAGEVRDPRRVLPRAIVTAIAGVAALYMLATYADFHLLRVDEVSQAALGTAQPIAAEAVASSSYDAATLVIVGIIVSTFGTVNAYVLASPRIYSGLARLRDFPSAFGRLNRHGAPHYGLWYQGVWASLLALSGSYQTLTDLVVLGLYVFYLATVVAYFRLRRAQPEAFTSFRMPLRPLPAYGFALVAVGVVAFLAYNDVANFRKSGSALGLLLSTTMLGVLLIGSGLVAYRLQARAARAPA